MLITEDTSILDLCKYANSTSMSATNYVPFDMRQSGTFTPCLTGKFIQPEASEGDSYSGLSGETIVCEGGV